MKLLDDRVVVFPGIFQLMRELADRLNALGTKNQKAYRCGS